MLRCLFFLLDGDFKIIFLNTKLTNIAFVNKPYQFLNLLYVHIGCINFLVRKGKAKIE